MSWRLIETAPKDGSYFLLFPPLWNQMGCDVGCFDNNEYAVKPKPYWRRLGQLTLGRSRQHPPTHWMPFPLPPES